MLACSRSGEQNKTKAGAAVGSASDTSAPVDTTTPDNLAGTRWRLVEIQSMDDAQGTTRPADRAKYTLAFDPEGGRLSMRLDCNRGSGPYEDRRTKGTNEGTMTIGPLAMTRAFCPPPSLGDRIARDMGYVRTYRVGNGRLMFSLMADGGIYVWEVDPTIR